MKNSKRLKLILQILICILIILIGTVGIYSKSTNMYKNIFPHDYTLGSDIDGITVMKFGPDDSTETIYYDKDGKEVDSSTITEDNKKNYESKEIPVNSEGNLNTDNYNICLKIMEERLKFLDTDQYQINLDEETGKILLSVEDDHIDDVAAFLPMEAKLQFIDSNTEDVVIDYTDFKSVESTYASLTNKFITYMNLNLNDSGIEKFNNIDKYKTVVEDEEKAEESKLLIMFDGQKIAEVSYDEMLLNGKTLRLTTASKSTSDTTINSQLNMEATVSELVTIGKMPVIYNLTAQEFVENDIGNAINYIVLILLVICAVFSLVLIIKYRVKGLLAVLGFITNISVFLILIRLTNVQISLNCFAGMFGLIVLNILLINNILKSIKNEDKNFIENIKHAYFKTLDAIVIMLVILLVLTVSSMTVIKTTGLLLFWGWIVTVFGNLIFMVPMLSIKKDK